MVSNDGKFTYIDSPLKQLPICEREIAFAVVLYEYDLTVMIKLLFLWIFI